jgi:hypothetical protein
MHMSCVRGIEFVYVVTIFRWDCELIYGVLFMFGFHFTIGSSNIQR